MNNFLPDVQTDDAGQEFIKEVIDGVTRYICNMSDRLTVDETDQLIQNIDSVLSNVSVLSLSNKNIIGYTSIYFENVALRELILFVWLWASVRLPKTVISQACARFTDCAGHLIVSTKSIGRVLQDADVADSVFDDHPAINTLESTVKDLPWLYIPLCIAMFYDFAKLEEIVASRISNRSSVSNSRNQKAAVS